MNQLSVVSPSVLIAVMIVISSLPIHSEIYSRKNKPRVSEPETPDAQTASATKRETSVVSNASIAGNDIQSLINAKRALEEQLGAGLPAKETQDRYENIVTKLVQWSDEHCTEHSTALQNAELPETVIRIKSKILLDSSFGTKIDPVAWSRLLLSADERYKELNTAQATAEVRRTLIRRATALSNEAERIRLLIETAVLPDDIESLQERIKTFKTEVIDLSMTADSDIRISPSIDELSSRLKSRIDEFKVIENETIRSSQTKSLTQLESAMLSTLKKTKPIIIQTSRLLEAAASDYINNRLNAQRSIIEHIASIIPPVEDSIHTTFQKTQDTLRQGGTLYIGVVNAVTEIAFSQTEPPVVAINEPQSNAKVDEYAIVSDALTEISSCVTTDDVQALLTKYESSIQSDDSPSADKAVAMIREAARIITENRFESWETD